MTRYWNCGLLSYLAPRAMMKFFHCALAMGSHGTTMIPSSGSVSTRKAAPPGTRSKIEKVRGFFVVVLLVAAAEVLTTVELVRDVIAVSYTHLRAHETPEHLV